MPGSVRQQYADIKAAQLSRQFRRPGRCADNQHPVLFLRGQPETPCDRTKRRTVQQHRAEDQREHDRYQQVGIRITGFHHAWCKHTGYRSGDNAARCNPANQQLVAPCHVGTECRQPDTDRARDKYHRGNQRSMVPIELHQYFRAQIRRQQYKHRRHQDDGDVFLETTHFLDAWQTHVAHHDAHHGHGQQAGLVLCLVGHRIHRQHQRDCHRALEIFRHVAATECLAGQPAGNGTKQHGGHHRAAKAREGFTQGKFFAAENEILEHQHSKQRADRIVDDAFPFQVGRGATDQHRWTQHRQDDGRSGDHDNGTKHQRDRP